MIEGWNRAGIIRYFPETDDIRDYIANSTCVVLPSYREGTSRVLLEAASMGRPLVATNVTGCKEIIEDNFNGFLCKVKDPRDLSRQMMKIIELSHEERIKMGMNGRRKVEKDFDQNIVFRLYSETIKTFLYEKSKNI